MPKPLVIVESPAKAKTIAKILGRDFVVESSIGHIRDLPASASEIPAAYRSEPWARLGVDVENDFKPLYVVAREKKQQIKKLKSLLGDASELYLATDEDREGESIAWHLLEVLSPRIPVKRMVFHEITRSAIEHALENPRDLDRRLVDAQEGRRILDRLYGYEVSPVLWKKVLPKLSAGRVQSVATRLVVDRERARMEFRPATYWDIEGEFVPDNDETPFIATLVAVDGSRLATGKDFDRRGALTRTDAVVLDEDAATALAGRLQGASFTVKTVEEKPYTRRPYAPFITSTLQQEASRKLRFSAQRAMQVAQRLYENGYITYMRTDSTILSGAAIATARSLASRLYGPDYIPSEPRVYKRKVRNAQEAHEAIRPAGDEFRMPEEVAREVSPDEAGLYELIWQRTVASQMADARGTSAQVRVAATSSENEEAEFAASGKTITFPGFLRAYVEGADDPDAELEDREIRLPQLEPGRSLTPIRLDPKGHSTQPDPRYTEATLVKELEDRGIGRPSTYASIISTILDRGYVWKKGTALIPSWTAFAVVGLLENHFSRLVDYDFTARMEDDLDEIAAGEEETVPWLRRFYFGNGDTGLHALVSVHVDEIDPREVNSLPLTRDGSGEDIVVRVGKFGPYLERGADRASIPEDLPPDELTVEKAIELLDAPSHDRVLGTDLKTGLSVSVRAGRFGPYFQLGDVDAESTDKPVTGSLLKEMDPATVTLDDALKVLSLPRTVGIDPSDGAEIVALLGRFGPYLKKGTDTRSLDSEDDLFTIELDAALALFAEPKRRRGGRASAPLRELGDDPATGAPIVLKEGRFGPYVTDGTTNASLPRGEAVESISPDRAADLLAEKRAKGPAKPRRRKSTKRSKSS